MQDGDDRAWIQSEHGPWRPAKFDGDLFDFSGLCTPQCTGRMEAVYRLRGYVRYTAKPRVPSYVITRGHYVAYFQEAGVWYIADDTRVEALERMPDAFPFICFFERVGAQRVALTELPPNPICAPRDSVGGAGRAQDGGNSDDEVHPSL